MCKTLIASTLYSHPFFCGVKSLV